MRSFEHATTCTVADTAGGTARGCRRLRVPKSSLGRSQKQSAAKAPGEMAHDRLLEVLCKMV